MAIFTRAQSNPQFPGNLPNPNPEYRVPDIAGSLDAVFNQYMASSQDARTGRLSALQQEAARQQIAAGQRQAVASDIQETAQFGAPLASFNAEDRARASAGITQGPGDQAGQDRLRRLAEGLHAISQKSKMAGQIQQADLDKTLSETDENRAQAEHFRAQAGIAGTARGTKAESDLRGELQTLSKPFIQVRDSMGRIEAAAKNPSAAGDLALIFNYMKVLDPGSTVREGEFATAQNSAGLPERVRAKYNQVINGERLADEQRNDFLSRARDLYQSQASIQKRQEEQYRGLAGRMGANPKNVILDQGLPAQGGQTPESIRADFQAGKITREQARASIAALRGGASGRP